MGGRRDAERLLNFAVLGLKSLKRSERAGQITELVDRGGDRCFTLAEDLAVARPVLETEVGTQFRLDVVSRNPSAKLGFREGGISMRIVVIGTIAAALFCTPAFARATQYYPSSQAPQTVARDPDPKTMHINEFQVFYVDDGSCPGGQIKKWTAGSNRRKIPHTAECVQR